MISILSNSSFQLNNYYLSYDFLTKYCLKSHYNITHVKKLNFKLFFLIKKSIKDELKNDFNILIRLYFIFYLYLSKKPLIQCAKKIKKSSDLSYNFYFFKFSLTKSSDIFNLFYSIYLKKKQIEFYKILKNVRFYKFLNKNLFFTKYYLSNPKLFVLNLTISLSFFFDIYFLVKILIKNINLREYKLGLNVFFKNNLKSSNYFNLTKNSLFFWNFF